MKIFLIALTFFIAVTVSNAQVLISLIFGDELNYRQYRIWIGWWSELDKYQWN